MRLRTANFGMVEWGVIFALLVLLVAEFAAFRGQLGWYMTVITIGFLFAMATAYLLYRHERAAARSTVGLTGMIKEADIFRGLTAEEMGAVASVGKQVRVPAGQVLGKAGEMGSHLYVISSGQVQLSAPTAVGQITVRIAAPGESFPLASVIGNGSLITTATAMTDVELLAIHRADLMEVWRQNPALGRQMFANIAEVLASRYRNTLAHLTSGAEQALRGVGFWANV